MKLKFILACLLSLFILSGNVNAQTFNAQTFWNAGDRTAGGKINLNSTGLSCLPDGMQLFSSSDSTFLAGPGITNAIRSITHQSAGCSSCGGSIRDEGQFGCCADSVTKYKFYNIEYYPRKYSTQPESNSNCLVKQIKTSTDNYPTWAIWMEPNGGSVKWSLHKTVDSLNTNNGSATQMVFYFSNVSWNTWAKFTIEANWSHTSAGYFKLYKDDVLIFTWNGATMNLPYNLGNIGYDSDRNGIYDFGLCPISGSDNTTQRELYMRNWKVGTSANTLADFITPAATGGRHYVSATGSDAADGLTPGTAWQTIAKVNASWASIDPGDSILFKAGDSFYGSIVVGKSGTVGNPIFIGAYGTGAKPIIHGLTTISSWTNAGGGIYTATVPARYTLLNVLYDGDQVRMGRTPNFNSSNGGYSIYESWTSNTAITDNELTNTPNWTGAEVVIRKYRWVQERDSITNHTNSVITYGNLRPNTINGATSSRYTPSGTGYGYFIQRHLGTLDALTEWFFNDNTNLFSMYFGAEAPNSHVVKVSTLDTLVNCGTRDYITIRGIDFEGAGQTAIYANGATTNANTIIDSCIINNCGAMGIQMVNQGNVTITNNVITNCLSTGIQNYSPAYPGFICQYNTVTDVFKFQGMADYGVDGSAMRGITFKVDNSNISFNTVKRVGYSGIAFGGDNVLIEKNVVDSATMMMDDNASLYTYIGNLTYGPPDEWNFNRVVRYNLLSNSTGNDWGTPSPGQFFASGVYMDGKSNGVEIYGNTIFNMPRGGVTMNNPQNVYIRDNVFYNCNFGVRGSTYKWGGISNFRITNNIFASKSADQIAINYSSDSIRSNILNEFTSQTITIDSNYYSPINPTPFRLELPSGFTQPVRNFTSWKATIGMDSKSVIAYLPPSYKVNSTTGSNLVTGGQNGTFNTSTASWTVASLTQVWDNTNQIAGGSLKVTFGTTTPSTYGYVTTNIGAVTSSKKYIVRFTLKGTGNNGIVRIYFRHLSPLSDLSERVYRSYGSSVQSFEVPLTAVVTDASANLIVEFDRSSGTTYIDNVSVYDANLTLTDIFATKTRLDTNATVNTKIISIGENYIGFNKVTYPGSITVPAYRGVFSVSSPLVTLSSYVVLNSLSFPPKLTKTSTGININPYSKAYNFVFKIYNSSNVLQSTTTNNNVSTSFNYVTPTSSTGTILYLTIEATRVSTGTKYTSSIKLVY